MSSRRRHHVQGQSTSHVRWSTTIVIAVVTAIVATFAPTSASAVPPATGESAPVRSTPQQVAFGYVGTAFVRPVWGCYREPNGTSLCIEQSGTPRYQLTYRRSNQGRDWQAEYVSVGRAVLTTPYGRGWQWIWSPELGVRVVPASALVKIGFIGE